MRNAMTIAAAIVTGSSVLAFYGGAFAGTGSAKTPTRADFDVCNRQAQQSHAGSASPGSTGAGSSVTSGVGAGAASGGTMSGGSTLNSSSSMTSGGLGVSGDIQLRGMATAGSSDPAYQQAYRDCMKKNGF